MLVKTETVSKKLNEICQYSTFDRDIVINLINMLKEKYDIPSEYSNDLLTLRKKFDNEPMEILYCFTTVLAPKNIEKYFTELERKKLSTYKYKKKKVKFPLKFKMVQIAEDQWVGRITAQQLMMLRDAQLIRYNANTQRQLKHVGNYYTIDIRQKTVNEIAELLKTDVYIPDPITLNIPEEVNFKYDEVEMELSIKSLEYFDILDGYHRYIAISKIYNLDSKFDYDMELRLVSFPEGKAQQFIWQQDQKTKMRKIDSEAMNQSNAGSLVATRLNYDRVFDLNGQISRSNGIIDYASIVKLINVYYFKNISKSQERKKIIEVTNELRDKINSIISEAPNILSEEWSYKFLLSVILCCANYNGNHMKDVVFAIYDELKKPEYKYISKSTNLRKKDMEVMICLMSQ